MHIEDTIVKGTPNRNRLIQYGFKEESGSLIYRTAIMDGDFQAVIELTNNSLDGHLYDADTDDEYTNFRLDSGANGYSHKVKEAYLALLSDIVANCFDQRYFHSPQANRLVEWLSQQAEAFLAFPFTGPSQDVGVFREKKTNKWFAFIMPLDQTKLGKEPKLIDIIDFKSNRVEELLTDPRFYPAYHMNKKKWITAILDDSLSDDELIALLNEGLSLVRPGLRTADPVTAGKH